MTWPSLTCTRNGAFLFVLLMIQSSLVESSALVSDLTLHSNDDLSVLQGFYYFLMSLLCVCLGFLLWSPISFFFAMLFTISYGVFSFAFSSLRLFSFVVGYLAWHVTIGCLLRRASRLLSGFHVVARFALIFGLRLAAARF